MHFTHFDDNRIALYKFSNSMAHCYANRSTRFFFFFPHERMTLRNETIKFIECRQSTLFSKWMHGLYDPSVTSCLHHFSTKCHNESSHESTPRTSTLFRQSYSFGSFQKFIPESYRGSGSCWSSLFLRVPKSRQWSVVVSLTCNVVESKIEYFLLM